MISAEDARIMCNDTRGLLNRSRYDFELVCNDAISLAAASSISNNVKIRITKSFHETEEYSKTIKKLKALKFNVVFHEGLLEDAKFIYRPLHDYDIEFNTLIISW